MLKTAAKSDLFLVRLLAAIALSGWLLPSMAIDNEGLAAVHAKVARQFETVHHIDSKSLKAAEPSQVLLLDVREPGEFAVSHLDAAMHISPDIKPDKLLELIGSKAAGKRVILYCSVGQRSSKLASLVQERLLKAGAASVENLSGGIFNWHNEGAPLVDALGPTDDVHPYNWWWGRHVDRKPKQRYEPRENAQ